MEVQTTDRLRSLFNPEAGPTPLLLLGAGSSQRSGIPLSEQIVGMAAKWAYCQANGHHPEDPSIKRSDWLRWVQQHPWYRKDVGAADNYSSVIHHLLTPRDNRREFFLKLIRPNVDASSGYGHLLELLDQRRIETVLTTNFDRVLPDLHVTRRRPHHLEIINTAADYTKFSTSPTHPQLVYLHGSVEHYTDRNLLEEVQRLDDTLVGLLTPLLRDHPLIVIGYRGAEPSIMQHLLYDQLAGTNGFRRGIFWCVLPDADIHPAVTELQTKLAGNLQLVVIPGFDDLMAAVAGHCRTLPSIVIQPVVAVQDDSRVPFDMRVTPDAALEELDWARVQVQLVAYCRKMQIDLPPTPIAREWLEARMEQLDLLRRTATGLCPTNAGYLMFALSPIKRIPGAMCRVRVRGEAERIVEGNLWRQLETLTELLAELNQAFRVKGSVSESVFPYPPLALKELLVNAMVHRSYEGGDDFTIDVDDTFVRFSNPGGLVEAVFARVNVHLQEQIALGARGIRGYRNTVIADLFYGSGAMDKEGSGLPDVHAQVQRNEGSVFFGPDDKNCSFRALIYRRAEDADQTTRTSPSAVSKSKYFANLLEVLSIPSDLSSAPTECTWAGQIYELSPNAAVPVFKLKSGSEIITFSSLTEPNNPLRLAIDTSRIQRVTLSSLVGTPEGQRNVVELLNRALYRHLEERGLLIDVRRKRCFFGRTDNGPREITYQASLRIATRTVTKPVASKRTGRILYWQHEAMAFGFERIGTEWALRILPGYVFTKNGETEHLHHSKVGPLATRKAARDFSLQVYNHLVFWTWVLSAGSDSFHLDLGNGQFAIIRGVLLGSELASGIAPDIDPPEDVLNSEDASLAQLEAELAEELDAESIEVSDAD